MIASHSHRIDPPQPPGRGDHHRRRLRLGTTWPAAIVIAAALCSATVPAIGQTLFYSDPAGAESMTTSMHYLAWSSTEGCSGFDICTVRAANGSNSSPPFVYIPYDNSAGPPSRSIASNLAARGAFAYWLSPGGQVLRRHVTYGRGEAEIVAEMENPGTTGEIAADDSHVYWIENVAGAGRLFRAPLDGGDRELVVEAPDGEAHDLQVDGTGRVYFLANVDGGPFCCIDPLHQVAADGSGGFTTTFSTKSFIDSYTLDRHQVFVASRANAGANLIISRGELSAIDDGASWTDLYDAGSSGPSSIHHLALSEDALFWHEENPAGGGPLLRLPRAGGTPDPLTVSLPEARDMLIGGDSRRRYVYYRIFGDIFRTATDAGTFSRDLAADEVTLEVTQAIQDSTHTVPLVEGKRTFVRAYARIKESSDGATQLPVFPAMLLDGRRSGAPLEGSPLRPVERRQVLRGGPVPDRTGTDSQFLFELPESWVHGTIVLTATVDPRDVEFETDESNNDSARTVTFNPVGGICMDIIPVLTTSGVESGGTLSTRARNFARARSLLPTDDLVWIFRGGSPKSKPWTGDPYNFMEEDDTRELMFHWWWDFNFSGTPPQCGSRRVIRTAVVSNAARFGLSSGSAALIYYLQTAETSPPWPAEQVPMGGVSGLAHEVGHQLGQAHIGCPVSGDNAPGNPDGSYPYAPCALENSNNHVGFDVISHKLIVPFDDAMMPRYQDYMSYQYPYWTSDYVYRNHFSELSSSSPSPPISGEGPLLVSGFERGDGRVEIAPAFELDGARVAFAEQVLADSTVASSDYRVHIYDFNNVLQVDAALRIARTVEEVSGDPVDTSFIGLVETQPTYEKIEIVDGDGNILAGQVVGTSPPTVTITSPTVGTALGDTVQVVWTGVDPDGDVLTYVLLYSPDGGSHWVDLVTTRDTQATVDMTVLPTGASARFEVMVSDGLHSASDTVGPFAVANRPPTATILLADLSEPVEPVTFAYEEPTVLRGLGYDSDDGPLAGPALEWSVTGATTVAGTGEALPLAGLPPGDYQVELIARDASGLDTSTSLPVTIRPKVVPVGTDPVLDGRCDDPIYGQDGGRPVLRYEGAEVAEVATARGDGYVYLCFAGLPLHQDVEAVELRLDPDASADSLMQPSDLYVRMARDGLIESGVGDGVGGDVPDADPRDVLGATVVNVSSWQAELRLHESLLSDLVRLGLIHRFYVQESVTWPEALDDVSPSTWGLVSMPTPAFTDGFESGDVSSWSSTVP